MTHPRSLRRRAAALLLGGALLGCAKQAVAPVATPPAPAGEPVLALRERFESDPEFGGEVYVLEAGLDDAPPLVLVHGLGTSGARDFERILPALSRDHHVLAFDLPGFGRSSRGQEVYAPQRFVRFVERMIARHFEGPVAVVGHSMGGAIAIALAGEHPERVERLALLDVAGILHYREYIRTVVRAELPDDDVVTRSLKAMRWWLFEASLLPVRHRKLEDLGLVARPRFRRVITPSRAAALLFVQHDFGPALRSVRAPAFVGWGRHDSIAPMRTAEALRYALRPQRFQVFEQSGHAPMVSEPEAVVTALRAFLDVPASSPRALVFDEDARREGVCDGERDRVFEGSYARIRLHRCKRALLRNVQTRALSISKSKVELLGVDVRGGEVGVTISNSNVQWTGGSITASTCMDTHESDLNLLAVRCHASRETLRVRRPSDLFASASELRRGELSVPLHGDYELLRTYADEPRAGMTREARRAQAEQRRAARLAQPRSRPLRAEDLGHAELARADLRELRLTGADLRGANLQGADMRGTQLSRALLRGADLRGARLRSARLDHADLRGADLRAADLREASLRGALYDDATALPDGVAPEALGMQHARKEAP